MRHFQTTGVTAISRPDIHSLLSTLDAAALGEEMHSFIRELFPICRSITGNGVRETLRQIGRRISLDVSEIPSGTAVFDWTVPKEWNISDAYVRSAGGSRVIDFQESNLHVVSYSVPVRKRVRLHSLREHIHTLPEHPDWIPYRTSYYAETWGFCATQRQLEDMRDEEYEVCIDSSLSDGHLTYAECLLPGAVKDEVLISCHVCHPSLANDNLSGIAVSTFLATLLSGVESRYSYRFLFIPGTIGSITWLALNEHIVSRVRHGVVLSCLGDAAPFTYKRSRRGDAAIDTAAELVLDQSVGSHEIVDFDPYGYDERQYCSPGFDMPVGALSRSRHGSFPEYHTSADNLSLVRPDALAQSLATMLDLVEVLEENGTYKNLSPKGEPQLGRRGLYRSMGGPDAEMQQLALLWVLNQSDGDRSLVDIARRAGIHFRDIREAADRLMDHHLLAPAIERNNW